MSELISVRLDDDAARALAELESTGLTRSQAVRQGLVDTAGRLRDRARLAREAEQLAADPTDRREMAAVGEMMEELRAPW